MIRRVSALVPGLVLAACAPQPHEPAMPGRPAEAVHEAGERWFLEEKRQGLWAGYGPPHSEARLAIACAENGQLVVSWMLAAGETLRVEVRSGHRRVRLDFHPDGGPMPVIEARIAPDHALASLLRRAKGEIVFSAESGEQLVVPADAAYRRVIETCDGHVA